MIENVFWPLADRIPTFVYSLGKYLRACPVPATDVNKAVVAFQLFSFLQLTGGNAYSLLLDVYKCSDNVS